ncbi:class I SAM-dependent methyltransferase, partial [Dactylosporangium fulvum]|uniref:class I SAM-dependent methyltransferase n=1 Tax=Dactylosporangium fulvum TaxID=53359 RepID=UPI0031E386F7
LDRAGRPLRRIDAAWYGELRPGDSGLLDRCGADTIDLGCGPGRITGALVAGGRRALGVDVSAQAVRYARLRGAPAVHGSLFEQLPGEGDWTTAVLADGNIGIGGDPVRLLDRCRHLVAGDGALVVEVDPPGSRTWQGEVVLDDGDRISERFGWAFVAVDDIARLADAAALRLVETWTEADRWFVRLARP